VSKSTDSNVHALQEIANQFVEANIPYPSHLIKYIIVDHTGLWC
jgi:hypothetical protein